MKLNPAFSNESLKGRSILLTVNWAPGNLSSLNSLHLGMMHDLPDSANLSFFMNPLYWRLNLNVA